MSPAPVSAPLDVGDDCDRRAAGERVLHHREADQHHDQHQAAEQRRPDDVVGYDAGDCQVTGKHPRDQQQPGRDQQHRAIEAVRREINDEPETRGGHNGQRNTRDAGGDRRIEHRNRGERAEKHEPERRDVRIAHVPAVEVEIGEQEHHQGGGEDRFARRAPDPFGVGRKIEHLAPESEIRPDIGEHCPAERRCGGKHHAALHDKQDSQEQCEQARDADDDAVVERE
jgi:hypothetical protein